MFSKYANTGFTTKVQGNFDQINDKSNTINYPEITKLLRDHGMLPQFISKEEVLALLRLINTVKFGLKAETNSLDYNGYLLLFP